MIKINDQIIETVQDGISWEGSKDTVARSLNFSIVYQPLDNTLPVYQVKKGDKITYSEDDTTYFYGYIEKIDYNTDSGLLNISCYDLMKRLLKSKCTGRFRGTLVQLANNICGSFGLKNGIESDSQHIHNIVSTGDMSYYDILKTACDVMFERYCLYLDGLTLKLANHDVINTFEIGKNIRSSTFSQSMTDIVNKVLIIDNKGNLVNTVQNSESINQYGLEKGITQGTGYRKMARELKAEMGTSFNNAFRLIRTEAAFIQGDINKTTYQQAADELGLEYYKYDAFLDSKTSEICRELDGKRFKVSEMEIGVNAPPDASEL